MLRTSLLAIATLTALSRAQAPPDDKPATISGTVTNALTGEPLLRAHVSLRGMAGPTRQTFGAITDAAGKFTFSVAAGSYTAGAERVGFSRTADRQGRMGAQVMVRAGDKKDDLQIKLNPNGAITGRVTDADGEPVEGIMVVAEATNRSTSGNATTDEKGEFRLDGLGPGKYRVRASSMNSQIPPEIRSDGTSEIQYAQTYYPNTLTAKEAARVTLGIGAEVGGVNIQLLRTPIVGVSGTVSGAPAAERIMIEALSADGRGRHWGALRADGTFQIWRLDPGKYSVSALSASNGQNVRSAPVDVEVAGANVDHIELRMLPPVEINGLVEFEDEQAKQGPQPPQRGSPQQQPQPSTPAKPPQMMVLLRESSGRNGSSGAVGSDGTFKLENLTPSRYRVSTSWGGVYVKSMRLGSQSIDGDTVDLTGGTSGAPLTLLISSATAEISGVVTDDKGPVAQVPVAVVTVASGMPSFPTMTSTGDDGSYKLTGVPPGKYKLIASEDNLFARSQDPDADENEVVEINQGDKLTRDIKLKPPGGN